MANGKHQYMKSNKKD